MSVFERYPFTVFVMNYYPFLDIEVKDDLEDIKETTEETKTKMDETIKNVGEIKIKLDEVLEKPKTEGKLPSFELFQFSKPMVFLSTALALVDTML